MRLQQLRQYFPICVCTSTLLHMQTFRRARSTLDDVSAASAQVIETSEWATVALVCVAAVSLVALLSAVIALGRVTPDGA